MQKPNIDTKTAVYIFIYAALGLNAFLIAPLQIKNIFATLAQSAQLQKKIQQYQQSAAQEPLLKNERDEITASIDAFRQRLVPLDGASEISLYISGKAKESGFDIGEIYSGAPVEYKQTSDGPLYRMPVTLQGTAVFHTIGTFIHALESGIYVVQIDTLSIHESSPYHQARIGLSVFLKE